MIFFSKRMCLYGTYLGSRGEASHTTSGTTRAGFDAGHYYVASA